jgi:outer membrane immunogenic protein
MRCRILCAGLLASVAAGAGSALAADIPVRPGAAPGVVPVASPSYINDWTGFYVGIHGGGGWGHESFENSISQCGDAGTIAAMTGCSFTTFQLPAGVSPSGGIFGFQFGHNWQWGPVVGGLETDFSGARLTGSSTVSFDAPTSVDTLTTNKKIDALASARGRLGYLIFPNLLFYGTAGVGWGQEEINLTNQTFFKGFLINEDDATSDQNMFGWVAGVGLEWKFSSNWLLRGEWLHYDFLTVTNSTNNPFFAVYNIDTGNVRTTVDVARAAISYKFGP